MAKSEHPSSSRKERDQMSGNDKILKLPQPLRHHILSKLPSEDAMRTMVLSKAWRDEWLTSPCLDLAREMWDRFPADNQLRIKFLDFAFRVLTRRNGLNCSSIRRLHLFLPGTSESHKARNKKQVDKLLRYAVTNFVIQELKLSSYCKDDHYMLPKNIIQQARFLTFLSLKCLILDQQTIATLAVSCPFLESLKLKFCNFTDPIIRISGYRKLLNFIVIATTSEDDVKVEIVDAPSLVKFRYFGLSGYRANSPHVDVVSDSVCKGLKHMDLYDVWFDRSSLSRVLSHLPNLQHLKLSCHHLCTQRLDICSPNLKYLELRLEYKLEQLHIEAPNVTDFVYTFHSWSSDAMPLICQTNGAAFNPQTVTINIESPGKKLGTLLQDVQFSQFVRQLDWSPRHLMARISILRQDTLPSFKRLHNSVYDFKHLVISFDDLDQESWPPKPATSQVLFTALVEPALCLFPNLQSCIIAQRNSEWEPMELKLEFKYKGLEIIGCWQQRIHEVKIENIRGSKMYLSALSTLFEEAIQARKMVIQC